MSTRRIIWQSLGLVVGLSLAGAAEPGTAPATQRAIEEGIPQAALPELIRIYKTARPAGEKQTAGLLLARAQLAAGRPLEARQTLDDLPSPSAPPAILLRASASAALGQRGEALRLLEPLASAAGPETAEARFQLARLHHEEGRDAEAIRWLDSAEPSPPARRLLAELILLQGDLASARRQLEAARTTEGQSEGWLAQFEGRLLLAEGKAGEAIPLLEKALAPDTRIEAAARHNAMLGLARAKAMLGETTAARDLLRELINSSPSSPAVVPAMSEWIHLERRSGADPTTDLRIWAAAPGSPRNEAARLLLAIPEPTGPLPGDAVARLQPLTLPGTNSEIRRRAILHLAAVHLALGEPAKALEVIGKFPSAEATPGEVARALYLEGRALHASGQPATAAARLSRAFSAATDDHSASAAAQAGVVAWLAAGKSNDAGLLLAAWQDRLPQDPALVSARLLHAADRARRGSPEALETLTRQDPAFPRAFEARLALAEYQLRRGDTAAAGRILRAAGAGAATPSERTAAEATQVFVLDADPAVPPSTVIKQAEDFLSRHPSADEARQVRLKLGELQLADGRFAAARDTFDRLASAADNPDLASTARFFAAQAAARTMTPEGATEALTWFDEVANGSGPLRFRARFEQASLLLRAGRLQDALTIYDQLLAVSPPPEVRLAAMLEKGDTLFARASSSPADFVAAAELYQTIAADPAAPGALRAQALCKAAGALARAGRRDEAIAAYNSVLDSARSGTPDLFWFYKAGFEAARLLEEQNQWRPALAIYDKMASIDGPQREAIVEKARRVRLENFIWED